jgi:hypothetical protein
LIRPELYGIEVCPEISAGPELTAFDIAFFKEVGTGRYFR